jgi:starch synthase
MAEKKRVLLITQEMNPYTEFSEMSDVVLQTAKSLQDSGADVRILMPRFGAINERRHRLHEVVRLSGMNIMVDDDDYPLIIKVASLPNTRLQVYFLDNDEFFKRKEVFADENGNLFDDNIDRMVFFCKGAIETVKKFGWSPDIVHCHGWITSLMPAYLRTAYRNEPVFQNAKIVYSLYNQEPTNEILQKSFREKSLTNQFESAVAMFETSDGQIDIEQGAIKYSDGLIDNMDYAPLIDSTATNILHKVEAADASNYYNFYNDLVLATV